MMSHIPSKTLKTLTLAVLLAPFACAADGPESEPVWQDAVIVRQGEREYELLTAEEADALRKKRQEKETPPKQKPDPGWIGDCYYYADGGYYHKDGVYWRPDMKTHFVYEEKCWHLADGGILTETGVYYPVIAAGRHPGAAVAVCRGRDRADRRTSAESRGPAGETHARDHRSSFVFGSMRRNSSTWIAGSARNSRSLPYLFSIS